MLLIANLPLTVVLNSYDALADILFSMPSRELHKRVSRLLVNDSCDRTHKIIDYPVRYLGRKHRILFHGLFSAAFIGLLADGYKGVVSGLSHVVVDKYTYSASSKRALKHGLEILEFFKKRLKEYLE